MRNRLSILTIRAFGILLLVVLTPVLKPAPVVNAAPKATITVNTLSGGTGGPSCTLRDAVVAANTNAATGGCSAGTAGADTINFSVTGTINLGGTLNVTQDLTIVGTGITLNGGGAVQAFAVGGTNTNFTLQDMTITNSTALTGGAINIPGNGANVTITNCVFDSNSATDVNGFGGGAIYTGGGTLQISGSRFTNNVASGNGGGAITTVMDTGDPNLTISNSTFTGNQATLVFNNSPLGNGGAIYSSGSLQITGSTFSGNNNAVADGGAIYHINGASSIINTTITGNRASGSGGGILYRNDANMTMNNVTIASNTTTAGNGGGLFVFDVQGQGLANVANTIIAGNTSTTAPDCVGSINSQGYNLIQSTAGCTINGVTTGNITGQNPLLGALANNGGSTQTMALVSGSPAINIGNPAAPGGAFPACAATDQRNVARPQGGRCDIGAYEVRSYTLTVTKNGTGTGIVTSNPAGINCVTTCTANFLEGTQITLSPVPSTGSTFAGWSGACSGTGACVVTLSAATSVNATFNLIPPQSYALTVTKNGTGTGTVTSNPAGINCGTTCTANFLDGTQVTLSAVPSAGSVFAGWSGACSGTGACVVTLSAAMSVNATFNLVAVVVSVPTAAPKEVPEADTLLLLGGGIGGLATWLRLQWSRRKRF